MGRCGALSREMAGERSCKHITLARYSSEFVCQEDFQLVNGVVESVKQGTGDILLKTLLISVDPWYKLCMHSSSQGLYSPPFGIGKPLPALVVSEVIASDNSNYQVGDFVTGLGTASEYCLIKGAKDSFGFEFRKLDATAVSLQTYLGVLGLPGFTAWIGIIRLGDVKPGDEVFVSAASGGVGLAAGQLAKAKGCRVVGSAGTDEKVLQLKEQFGFDAAFNYKTEADWNATLARLFPNGIDIYFDNVGGQMLEAALNHIKHHARISISGMVSQYNEDCSKAYGIKNLMNLVGRCAKMEGFLALDSFALFQDFTDDMLPLVLEGKVSTRDTITHGIENFPAAFVGMMKGQNIGKALVKL